VARVVLVNVLQVGIDCTGLLMLLYFYIASLFYSAPESSYCDVV